MDLVSREWLLSEYDKRHEGPPGGARKIMEEAPTIEQPTPTDWIKMSDADGEYYCCNNCGEDLPRYQLDTPTVDKPFPPKMSIERTRFCPNCGARMVKK